MLRKNSVINYGMVGGGPGSFIGDVHRKAAGFDHQAGLVAACFSRDYEQTKLTGEELGLELNRLYKNYKEMAEVESARQDGIDFVSIVTPNASHYSIARTFLEKGINVVCDKPLTIKIAEAEELVRLSREKDLLFGVTYAYTGYPMVKQARQIIKKGKIGEVRMVIAEYPQEWLASPVEKLGQKQAIWRTDPELAGISGCVGDIGSHIENIVSYITGLKIESLYARLDTFGEDRSLDDNAALLLKYNNGASGVYWCSQVAIGESNGLRVRIYGESGKIEWEQESPNQLLVAYLDKPLEILEKGRDQLDPSVGDIVRLPAGHPEGYYEAFANLYKSYISALIDKKRGKNIKEEEHDYPTVEAGLEGVRFINLTVSSSKTGKVEYF
jgi:predicted dehydrogenase